MGIHRRGALKLGQVQGDAAANVRAGSAPPPSHRGRSYLECPAALAVAVSPAAGVSSTTGELTGVTCCPGDDIHSPAGIRRSHHRPSFVVGGSAGWVRPMASEAGLAADEP